jgi:S-phase kinase-associated protein 1
MVESILKIIPGRGPMFLVEESVICKSKLIMRYVEDSGTDQEIDLPGIKPDIFEKVLEFCRHYKGITPQEIPKPLNSPVLSENVPNWDANFVELEQDVLFDLILAAHYLEIKSLVDLTCAKVASVLKGKSGGQIREMFNFDDNLIP